MALHKHSFLITGVALPVKRIKAKIKPKGYWLNPVNVRQFFCEYAEEAGFDPLQSDNWKNVTAADVNAKKVHSIFEISSRLMRPDIQARVKHHYGFPEFVA